MESRPKIDWRAAWAAGALVLALAGGPASAQESAPSVEAPTMGAPASDAAPQRPAEDAPARSADPSAHASVPTPPGTAPAPAPATDATVAETLLPHDLSPWGMFMAADIVVKGVMGILALASFLTWTVLVAKSFELAAARRKTRVALKAIHGAPDLATAIARNADRDGAATLMLRAARAEADLSGPALDAAGGEGLKERVGAALTRIEANAVRRASVGTGILATIGSVAPFVGLFGTVWGIMNSFIGISQAKTTNLAIVAPGIAEALLATAIGLVAAIPAVVIYNHFARATARYRQLLADAATGVQILVSRDLDFRALPRNAGSGARAAAE